MSRQFGIMERRSEPAVSGGKLKIQRPGERPIDRRLDSQVFRDRETQVFRKQDVDDLLAKRLSEKNLTAEDFARFVRHEVGIQHLRAVAGLSGKLLTPQEGDRLSSGK